MASDKDLNPGRGYAEKMEVIPFMYLCICICLFMYLYLCICICVSIDKDLNPERHGGYVE